MVLAIYLKSLWLVIFLFSFSCVAVSQKKSLSRASQKHFNQGLQWTDAGNYAKAREAFLKAIHADPNYFEAFVQLGALAFEKKDWKKSAEYFNQALALDSVKNPMIHFKLGELYWFQDEYDIALRKFQRFARFEKIHPGTLKKVNKYIRDSQFILEAPQYVDFKEKRLPIQINTSLPEYLPSLTADETKIVFTRRINGQEDFYISEKIDSTWSESQPISDLNTSQNEGAHCLSADGKLLIFTACHRKDGLGSCDLYYSTFNGTSWSRPQNLGSSINSRGWEGQPSLSASSRHLYFSSDRSGGEGGRDIWIASRNSTGWDPPQNIRSINTSDNEEVPFIHADDATLYFMSNGWPGFGSTDLYLSKKLNGVWQKPLNLGAPINSKAGEGALHVNVAGKTGYFARTIEDQIDIFSFEIPERIKPNPATYVQWIVKHRITGEPLNAIVTITDLKLKKAIRKMRTNADGESLVCLPAGIDYAFTVEKEGFAFFSKHYNLDTSGTLIKPAKFIAYLEPITETEREEESEPIVLNNVFFEFGKAQILEKSQPELNRLALLMLEKPKLHIRIQGHTDNIGSDLDNLLLSEDRARAIYQFLIEHDVQSNRMEYVGFGSSRPIADNDTEAGRQQNRRSEFVIIKHDQ